MRKSVLIVALLFYAFPLRAGDRFWIKAKINGTPETFIFDTGSPECILSVDTVQDLGLKSHLNAHTTDDSFLKVGDQQCFTWFIAYDLPGMAASFIRGLKILGWPLLRENLLQLDAETGVINPLKTLPSDINEWVKIPLYTNTPYLAVNIGTLSRPGIIGIDTGDEGGILLPQEAWRSWRRANPSNPATLNSGIHSDGKVTASEECWAPNFILGPIRLTETPVCLATPIMLATFPKKFYLGELGMAALKRLDLVVDGENNFAYIRAKTSPALPYEHNRMALALLPQDPGAKRVLAQVITGGPAYEAGIRNGDTIVKINGRSIKESLSATNFSSHTREPAGGATTYTIERGRKRFEETFVCQNIIGPTNAAGGGVLSTTNDFEASDVTLKLTPRSPREYYNRGREYMYVDFYAKAVSNFNEAIRSGSNNPWCYCGLSVCYNRLNQFSNAVCNLNIFLGNNPSNSIGLVERGYALMSLGDYDLALADLNLGIRIDPRSERGYKWRARANLAKQNYTDAIHDFRKACRLDRDDPEVFADLSSLEAVSTDPETRDVKDAIRKGRKACELSGWKEASYLTILGTAYAEAGDFEKAIQYEKQFATVGTHAPEELAESQKRIAGYEKRQIYAGANKYSANAVLDRANRQTH